MDYLENIQFDSMGHNHETKCSKCGARLYIHEAPLLGASIGCKTYEEVECPNCGNVVYSAFSKGYFIVRNIDKTETL